MSCGRRLWAGPEPDRGPPIDGAPATAQDLAIGLSAVMPLLIQQDAAEDPRLALARMIVVLHRWGCRCDEEFAKIPDPAVRRKRRAIHDRWLGAAEQSLREQGLLRQRTLRATTPTSHIGRLAEARVAEGRIGLDCELNRTVTIARSTACGRAIENAGSGRSPTPPLGCLGKHLHSCPLTALAVGRVSTDRPVDLDEDPVAAVAHRSLCSEFRLHRRLVPLGEWSAAPPMALGRCAVNMAIEALAERRSAWRLLFPPPRHAVVLTPSGGRRAGPRCQRGRQVRCRAPLRRVRAGVPCPPRSSKASLRGSLPAGR